ncbi:MAG: pre-toxin TG domain-containing protein [Candidatus Omnitrophota bacterium]|nr:pre-toxin TG domain-containing protein [Candidatus Omnitrophota bacterium]
MRFVFKLFLTILFFNPGLAFASAFLPGNTPQSKLTDPQEITKNNTNTLAADPSDALLTLFRERVTGIFHDIAKTKGEIQKSPNDPKSYYRRALLSFELLLLDDAIRDCASIKFYNHKLQSFFYVHYLRNSGILKPVYDEIIQHPSCGVAESSESLKRAYEDVGRLVDVYAYPVRYEYAFDPSQDLLRAIQLDGHYREAYLLRADLLSYDKFLGSNKELNFFDELIKRFPDDAFSYIQRTEYQNEGHQHLIESCKRSQDIDPALFESYLCLYRAWENSYEGDFCENNSYCAPRLLPQENEIYARSDEAPAYGDPIYYRRFLKEQIEKVQSLNPDYPGIDGLVRKARKDYLGALASFEEGKCKYLQFYDEKESCDKIWRDCKEEFKICDQEKKRCYKQAENNFERCKQDARARINSGQIPVQAFLNPAQSPLPEIKKQIQKDIDTVQDLKRVVDKASQETKKIEYDQFENIVENVAAVSKRNGITKEELLFPQSLIFGNTIPSDNADNVSQLKVNVGDLLISTARLGVGSIPVIGNVVSMYEFLSGKDLFTGERLGGLERTISCLGIFVGSGKAWAAVAGGMEKGLAGQLASKVIRDIPEGRKSLDKAVSVFKNSLTKNTETALGEAEAKAVLHGPPTVGQKVYRIIGKDVNKNIDAKGAEPFAPSWTPINPSLSPNPRSSLGLPDQNKGRFVVEGRIVAVKDIKVKPADELHGNPGQEIEYFIPDSESQIKIERVSGVNPEF